MITIGSRAACASGQPLKEAWVRLILGGHQVSRNRSKAVATLVALTTSLLVSLLIQSANATIGTNDYPSNLAGSPPDALVDPWGFYNRECTSFVAWRMNNDNRVAFTNNMKGPNGVTGHWGNADQWRDNATKIGYGHNAIPARGSIAWYAQNYHGAGPAGHVAYVDAVNPDGSIVVEEYNARAPPYTHLYGKRTLLPRSSSWPSEFLHVKDLTPPPPPPPPPPSASGDSTATVRADFNGDGKDDVLGGWCSVADSLVTG
jgi:surface antigen